MTATLTRTPVGPGHIERDREGWYRSFVRGEYLDVHATASEAEAAVLRVWDRTPPSAMHAVLAGIGEHARAVLAQPTAMVFGHFLPTTIIGARTFGATTVVSIDSGAFRLSRDIEAP